MYTGVEYKYDCITGLFSRSEVCLALAISENVQLFWSWRGHTHTPFVRYIKGFNHIISYADCSTAESNVWAVELFFKI